jgi:hypothetical protein
MDQAGERVSARTLASVLADFDAGPDEPEAASGAGYPPESGPIDALAAARHEGFEAGLAKARALAQQDMQAEAGRALSERALWTETESRLLSLKIDAGLANITTAICDQLAQTLRPVIFDAVAKRAVETMAEEVRALLADADAATVKISGPDDLIAALREKLSDCATRIDFQAVPGVDAIATLSHARIETRLAAWRARLQPEAA